MSPLWYKRKDIYEREEKILADEFPEFKLVEKNQKIFAQGVLRIKGQLSDVDIDDAYVLEIEFPDNYPRAVPLVRETGGRKEKLLKKRELTNIGDLHYNNNAANPACLCSRNEQDEIFFHEPNIRTFIKELVIPFFSNQSYFEQTGKWMVIGYDHGKAGVLQSYQDKLGIDDEKLIVKCLILLSKKGGIKGHTLCPCGSSKKIRDCHNEIFRKLWKMKKYLTQDAIVNDIHHLAK